MVTSLESPKSFKLDRKSSSASKLKKLLSDKLSRIFPDYSDDVLAEYITVLVCNGKNQNQAIDDLEAFLGQRTEDFVAWLWDLLLKGEHHSAVTTFSKQKDLTSARSHDSDVDEDVGAGRVLDLQGSKTGGVDYSLVKVSSDEEVKLYHSSNGAVPHNNAVKPKEVKLNTVTTQACVSETRGHFVNDGSVTYFNSVPFGGEETLSVNSWGKMENSKYNGLLSPRASLPRNEAFSITSPASLLETHTRQQTAGTAERSAFPTRMASLSHQNKKRRSVWDRLGRPAEVAPIKGGTSKVHGDAVIEYNEESSSLPTSTDLCGRYMRHVDHFGEKGWNIHESGGSDHGKSTSSRVPDINNIGRKRHISETNGYPGNGLVCRRRVEDQCEKSSQGDKISKSAVEASQPVVSQLHDWKLRLLQIENEVSKLRKQVEREKGRKTIPLSDSGILKPAEEDMESRTVLVTNVHFVATKEALSLYFGKCGKVVNVVLLTDKLPHFPQRSAYITFASQDSAEKALGLSGMSFYSRAIKVVRKGEKAATASMPFQSTGNQSHSEVTPVKKNVVQDQPYYPSSHLKWRRHSIAPTLPKVLASTTNHGATTGASQEQPSALPVSQSNNTGSSCGLCPISGLDETGEVELSAGEAAGL